MREREKRLEWERRCEWRWCEFSTKTPNYDKLLPNQKWLPTSRKIEQVVLASSSKLKSWQKRSGLIKFLRYFCRGVDDVSDDGCMTSSTFSGPVLESSFKGFWIAPEWSVAIPMMTRFFSRNEQLESCFKHVDVIRIILSKQQDNLSKLCEARCRDREIQSGSPSAKLLALKEIQVNYSRCQSNKQHFCFITAVLFKATEGFIPVWPTGLRTLAFDLSYNSVVVQV